MKFCMDEKVIISNGFYKGKKGVIKDYDRLFFTYSYLVRFKGNVWPRWIKEKNMEKR